MNALGLVSVALQRAAGALKACVHTMGYAFYSSLYIVSVYINLYRIARWTLQFFTLTKYREYISYLNLTLLKLKIASQVVYALLSSLSKENKPMTKYIMAGIMSTVLMLSGASAAMAESVGVSATAASVETSVQVSQPNIQSFYFGYSNGNDNARASRQYYRPPRYRQDHRGYRSEHRGYYREQPHYRYGHKGHYHRHGRY